MKLKSLLKKHEHLISIDQKYNTFAENLKTIKL